MAKKKIYAVRKGHKTGLFYTWDECKKAVHGYSGAEYKGFLTKEEAEAFLNIGAAKTVTSKNSSTAAISMDSITLTTSTSDRLVVYVDGSFDVNLQKYSFGCVILLEDGRIVERSGNGDEPELLAIRNVERCMVQCMRYSGHLKMGIPLLLFTTIMRESKSGQLVYGVPKIHILRSMRLL